MQNKILSFLKPTPGKISCLAILASITVLLFQFPVAESNPILRPIFYFLSTPIFILDNLTADIMSNSIFMTLMVYGIVILIEGLWLYILSCGSIKMLALPHAKRIIVPLLLVLFAGVIYFLVVPQAHTYYYLTPESICNRTCLHIQYALQGGTDPLYPLSDYCLQYVPSREYSLLVNDQTDSLNFQGEKISCRNVRGCFNLPDQECTFKGEIIGPRLCRDALCKYFKRLNLTIEESEERIRVMMTPIGCNMTRKGHPELQEETWWEKYYRNPDCSEIYQNASQNDSQ